MKKLVIVSSLILGASVFAAQAAEPVTTSTLTETTTQVTNEATAGAQGLASDYQAAKDHAAQLKSNAKTLDFENLQKNKEALKGDVQNLKTDVKEFKFNSSDSTVKTNK